MAAWLTGYLCGRKEMPEITFTLKIRAGKNDKGAAVAAFVRVHPNTTADPLSPDYVPADPPRQPKDGLNDREWMKRWTRRQLNEAINEGLRLKDLEDNYTPPVKDPDIVEEETPA